jgi:drug/metabolite transporter (DMT)-like permease
MTRLRADLLLLAAAAVWGLGFYFQKVAMEHLSPLAFIAGRALLAVLALPPFALREGARTGFWPTGLARYAGFASLLFLTAAWLQQSGLLTTGVTNAGFLTSLYVVATPLLVWLWQRERPSAAVLGAIGLAVAGAILLGGGSLAGFARGDWLIAACALFWSAHLILVGRAGALGRPVTFMLLQFAGVGVLAGLAMAIAGEGCPERAHIERALPALLFVGVLSSALTYVLLAVAMRHTPAPEAAVLVSLETLFTALAGALLLGERLAPIAWAGALLMLLAGILVQLAAVRAAGRC